MTVFSLDFHTNDLTRNGGLFVSSFLERFLDRSDVYAILSSEAKVVDIVYFDNNTKAELLPSLKAKLWDLNVDKGRVWDDHYYLTKSWDGKHEYKKLGEEHFKHYLMYETNGPSALVENANKLGWQIRDLQQFNLEQRVIKQMAAR